MKFETFLEDYSWFDKKAKPGTTFRAPIKRDVSWLKADQMKPGDLVYFGDLIEESEEFDDLKELIATYKKSNIIDKRLREFINGCKLNRDYILYRNFGGIFEVDKLKIGSTFTPKSGALTPTSLDYRIALDFKGWKNTYREEDSNKSHSWTARIQAKKGQRGCFVDHLGFEYDAEDEMLLAESTFKVIGFSYAESKYGNSVIHTIDCEISHQSN